MMDPKTLLGAAHDPAHDYRFVNLRRRPLATGWTPTGQVTGELTLISRLRPVVAPAPPPVPSKPVPPKLTTTTAPTAPARGMFQRKGSTS